MALQSSERPVGHMAAALVCAAYASRIDSLEREDEQALLPPKALKEITLPEPFPVSPPSTPQPLGQVLFRDALMSDMNRSRRDYTLAATRQCSAAVWEEYIEWYHTKTTSQNHLQRSSPPLQPGEQNFPGKLPSFDEFVQTTIERTPPHTPSRRTESTENSPRVRPQFDDVAWSDSKRRRVDTLGDIYARPSNAAEYPPTDPRRMSSAIDPALYHAEAARARLQSAGPSHHRPNLLYPPAPASQHVHHHQPVAPGNVPYQQPPIHAPRMVVQGSYAQLPPQPGTMYERRQSYYQDPHMQQHAYPYDDRRESMYYANQQYAQPPAGYEQGYYDVRFQQHVGVDHNAFNRKRRGNLPKEATNILKDWFQANRQSPYPTEDQKLELCRRTSLSLNQVSNWFINARRRAPQKEQRERHSNVSSEQ